MLNLDVVTLIDYIKYNFHDQINILLLLISSVNDASGTL